MGRLAAAPQTEERSEAPARGEVAEGGAVLKIYTDAAGRLTEEGSKLLAEFMAKWPNPSKLLYKKWPGLYRRAIDRGYCRDEIDCICNLAAVVAARDFDADRSSFTTYIGWRFFAALRKELHRPKRQGARMPRADLFLDSIPDHREVDRFEREEWRADLRKKVAVALDASTAEAMARCPTSRRREIFAAWHGLGGAIPRKTADLAAAFGISPDRVRQTEKSVLQRLAPALESLGRDM